MENMTVIEDRERILTELNRDCDTLFEIEDGLILDNDNLIALIAKDNNALGIKLKEDGLVIKLSDGELTLRADDHSAIINFGTVMSPAVCMINSTGTKSVALQSDSEHKKEVLQIPTLTEISDRMDIETESWFDGRNIDQEAFKRELIKAIMLMPLIK